MPWECVSVKQQRLDLVLEMIAGRCSVAALCRQYGVRRKTAYKWLGRYRTDGLDGLQDRSRRPQESPAATAAEVSGRVVALREQYPQWGAGKLRALLQRESAEVPCERTIHRIVKREGLAHAAAGPAPPPQSFERREANELWQLDFKGAVRLGSKSGRERGVPLTIIDDHSRFLVSVHALPNHQLETFWPVVWEVFGEYGLPQAILTDNENGLFASHRGGVTRWTARLWRLGIRHPRGRPYHPQTQGKVERSHGTLQREALAGRLFASLPEMQQVMDEFRTCYNHLRPHEALGQQPPITRYAASTRPRPSTLPPVQFPAGADLRAVTQAGYISLRGCRLHVGEGLSGEKVEVRDEGAHFSLHYGAFEFRALPWDALRSDHEWL